MYIIRHNSSFQIIGALTNGHQAFLDIAIVTVSYANGLMELLIILLLCRTLLKAWKIY